MKSPSDSVYDTGSSKYIKLLFLSVLQDQNDIHVCGYSGRKFMHKKYYDAKVHGPSITYEEYLEEMNPQEQDWPN